MELKGKVHYVGVNDRTKALFENLWPLPYGVSYNSYLIADDDMVALVDTVDVAFFELYLKKIRSVIGDRKWQIEKIRVYFSGDNVCELTGVKDGYDPEKSSASRTSLPFNRSWTLGLDVTF